MLDRTPLSSSAADLRIGVAVSRYHADVTEALEIGARGAFSAAGGRADALIIAEAPGSFELVAIATALARRGDLDAIVALGCIITGETTHDQYLASAIANGLASISVELTLPTAFGVLTCQTMDQARARAGGDAGNKGEEAMLAAISTANTVRSLQGIPSTY